MTIVAKIPCTIVTGFLGAGKTTLVRHVVENAKGRKLAILVNEFGDVGFDKSFLAACGVEGCTEDAIVELPNGCICCTVADDFVPALETLLARAEPPEHILIETSGLALPKPLVQAFQWPAIRSRVTVDGVVAVVDGPAVATGAFAEDPEALAAQRAADTSVDHDNPLEEVFEDQLLCADLVVLNKADLMDAAGLAKVRADIEGHLPRAVKMIETSNGAIDPRVLLGLGAAVRGRPRQPAFAPRRGRGPRPRRLRDRGPAGALRRDGGRSRRPGREGGGDRGRPADQGLRRGRGQADAPRRPGRRAPGLPPFRPALRAGEAKDGRLVVIA